MCFYCCNISKYQPEKWCINWKLQRGDNCDLIQLNLNSFLRFMQPANRNAGLVFTWFSVGWLFTTIDRWSINSLWTMKEKKHHDWVNLRFSNWTAASHLNTHCLLTMANANSPLNSRFCLTEASNVISAWSFKVKCVIWASPTLFILNQPFIRFH